MKVAEKHQKHSLWWTIQHWEPKRISQQSLIRSLFCSVSKLCIKTRHDWENFNMAIDQKLGLVNHPLGERTEECSWCLDSVDWKFSGHCSFFRTFEYSIFSNFPYHRIFRISIIQTKMVCSLKLRYCVSYVLYLNSIMSLSVFIKIALSQWQANNSVIALCIIGSLSVTFVVLEWKPPDTFNRWTYNPWSFVSDSIIFNVLGHN